MTHRSRSNATTPRRAAATLGLALAAGLASPARADETVAEPVILQWFELSWKRMERRIPDFFVAGYGATWVAPISKANDPTSPGFDVFDRFDLGRPNIPGDTTRETIYGTEQGFRSIVEEFHRANGLIYVDSVMNHNSGRSIDANFYAAGGYPGFWAGPGNNKVIGSGNWGDFHNGAFQSQDPQGAAYNLWLGDLVSLIDIDQSSSNQFIRHPVADGDPQNIPPGTARNRPDPGNVRFYADLDLAPLQVNNPGIARSACCGYPAVVTSPESVFVFPFNTLDPTEGDPIAENATGLLVRWTQWMLDEFGIDGYRLDAAKHIEPWFWDRYWDPAVYHRRHAPDGSFVTPYSFGEAVDGNQFIYNYYIRRDGFGDRDALDLSGAGNIRNLIGAKGSGNVGSIASGTLDEQDGFNNGTIGVNHIHSHDNGSAGNGGSAPDFPYEDKVGYWAYAYLLMRPGHNIVYHNAREMHDRFVNRGGFWPREGVPTALGLGSVYRRNAFTYNCSGAAPAGVFTLTQLADQRIPDLVRLANRYGRGWFVPRSSDGQVYAFERQTPGGVGNVLVGINDEWDACPTNYDQRSFNTAFPVGSVLVELTGNAADATVDPLSQIPETITVGAGGSVTIRVPRNTARSGTTHTEHARGYVIYGPATPQGTLALSNVAQTLPPDSSGTSVYARRLTPIEVIQAPTFQVQLTTNKNGYPVGDPNFDDTAIFRINQGFADYNGVSGLEPPLNTPRPWDVVTGEFRGYEGFATVNQPTYISQSQSNAGGLYAQTIDTSQLNEGYNYISVLAFRQRNQGAEAGGLPLFNEWRKVIYVDRLAPTMELASVDVSCASGAGSIRVRNPDRTVTRVHIFIDEPVGSLTLANQAQPFDRREWTFNVSGLADGQHTARIVALEEPSAGITVNQSTTIVQFSVGALRGDTNLDGSVNFFDLYSFATSPYQCESDVNADGQVTSADLTQLEQQVRQNEIGDITVFQP